MTTNLFKRAERKQAKLKIAITGPSGSGKTFSALLIADGIGQKIAVIDTENRSASLYAGMDKGPLAGINFDILEIEPPYTIRKYLDGIEAAEKAGYDVLVVDSLSHAWAGEGGLLDKKTALDARGGNSYTNWAQITPEQERFKSRILQADVHVICTMRSKQDYVLEVNEKGKSAPRKVGLAPIQRDGMEYEFTTVLDMAMDHNAVASKDRTGLFDGMVFKPSRETGIKIMKWLKAAKPIEKPEPRPAREAAPPATEPPAVPTSEELVARNLTDEFSVEMVTPTQQAKIDSWIKSLRSLGRSDDIIWRGIVGHMTKVHKRVVAETAALSKTEAETVIEYLTRWVEHLNNPTDGKGA